MTSTLDRDVLLDEQDMPPLDEGAPSEPEPVAREARPTAARRTPAFWTLAVLCAAAGLIHLVMVPTHFDASTADGVAFLAAGWAQLLLAVALVLRPRRSTVVAAGLVTVACIGAWVMAHSVGLPFGAHKGAAETATFVSQVTVALEAAFLLLAVAVVANPRIGTRHRGLGLAFAGIAILATVALTTAAVASPSARSSGHGDEAAAGGHGHGAGAGHDAAGAGSDTAKTASDRGYSLLDNGHEHAAAEPEPLTQEEELLQLQQLSHAYQLQARYPTLADAEAAGYTQAGPFAPGLGVHYSPMGGGFLGGETDGPAGAPEVGAAQLIYDGTTPDSRIAGFMYMARSFTEEPQEGFVGNEDVWHYHTNVCLVFGPDGVEVPLGADLSATQAQCDEFGGFLIPRTNYMVHLWTVPGYESSEGLYSNLNPALTCPNGTYYQLPADEWASNETTCAPGA